MEDKFENIESIKKWDYYNNGNDPNRLGYKTKLWNTAIVYQDHKIFEGDLSKERISFLVKLSKQGRYHYFIIMNERNVPMYFISCGKIYELMFVNSVNIQRQLISDDKMDANDITEQKLTWDTLVNKVINYWPQKEILKGKVE